MWAWAEVWIGAAAAGSATPAARVPALHVDSRPLNDILSFAQCAD